MNVFVTGGLGFQGARLTWALRERGDAVTVLGLPSPEGRDAARRTSADVHFGSVLDGELVERLVHGQDLVYHLAALTSVPRSLESPRDAYEVNLIGTLRVVEACARYGVPVVYASTCEVYGSGAGLTERSPLFPASPYAASKAAADRLVYAWRRSLGLRAVTLRPCNIFGAGQKPGPYGGVIPIMLDAARRGDPLKVHGDGLQSREYLDVRDMVRAYLAAADLGLRENACAGGVFNVTSREAVTVREIADRIGDAFGVRVEHVPGRPADPREFGLDDAFFRDRTGWAPQVAFQDGFAQLLAEARR